MIIPCIWALSSIVISLVAIARVRVHLTSCHVVITIWKIEIVMRVIVSIAIDE